MKMDKKKAVFASLKWQLIVWTAGLAIFGARMVFASKKADKWLFVAGLFAGLLMIIMPFYKVKTFVTIFDKKPLKIFGGFMFIMALEAVTIGAFQAINVSGWESAYQKESRKQAALNEPKRRAAREAIIEGIYALKTEAEAFKYIEEAIQRKKNHDYSLNDIGLYEYEELTDFLYKTIGRFSMQATVEMLLMLEQYGGADDSEYRSEIFSELMVKDPKAVIDAVMNIEARLLPEFKDKEFIKHPGCGLPTAYYEEKNAQDRENMKAQMRAKLKSIMNDRNKEQVMYYIDTCFKAGEED